MVVIIFFILLFAIAIGSLYIAISAPKKIKDECEKTCAKLGGEIAVLGFVKEGLTVPNKSQYVTIVLLEELIQVVQGDTNFKVPLDRVIGTGVVTDIQYKEKQKSSIGRAVVGGVLAGGVGAIVGGVSGAGTKKVTTGVKYLLVITYKTKEGDLSDLVISTYYAPSQYREFVKKVNSRVQSDGAIEL